MKSQEIRDLNNLMLKIKQKKNLANNNMHSIYIAEFQRLKYEILKIKPLINIFKFFPE